MSKKQRNHSQNVKDQLDQLVPQITSYQRKMVLMPNQGKAEKQAAGYITELAETVIGEERHTLTLELTEKKEKAAGLKKAITEERKLLAKTSKMIRVKDLQKKDSFDAKEQQKRKILDMMIGFICMLCGFSAIGISMTTMYSVVMSSGNPVFLENTALAWAMCSVLGLGALAFEFFKRYLETDKCKRRYGMTVYILTASLLLTWIVMFAVIFGSAADQAVNIDAMLSGSGSGAQDPWMTAFTVIQLLAEFFVGCAFFMTGGDLFGKYAPTRMVNNPDYEQIKARLNEIEAEYEAFTDDMHAAETRLSSINRATSLFIKEQMAQYQQLRAQLTD